MAAFVPPATYRALRVSLEDGAARRAVLDVPWSVLPDHDVTVRVSHSSLNYKDALSASGNRGVTRDYPHTPGIDAAGTVVASRDPRFAEGDAVVCTGFDHGMGTAGGLAEYVRVPGDWLVHRPAALSARDAMAFGTAGLTAALAVDRMAAAGATAALGPAVVTGASGGVGSLAVALLAGAGYEVVASTGKTAAAELLGRLGAARTLPRAELATESPRPLLSAQYAGGVDTVGGATLANLLKSTAIGGAVAACGLVGGSDVPLTVFPFILRGVALLGVDSQHAPMAAREAVWERLATDARLLGLVQDAELVRETRLAALEEPFAALLAGGVTGRIVVRL
jgi:alcohol dehydrogenase